MHYMVRVDGEEVRAWLLESGFQRSHSNKFTFILRLTSLIVGIISTLLISHDHTKFGSSHTNFLVVLILRLGLVVPVCAFVIGFTFSPYYFTHTQALGFPLALLGIFIIVYELLGKDPSYGQLAVFIVYVFRFVWLASFPATVCLFHAPFIYSGIFLCICDTVARLL